MAAPVLIVAAFISLFNFLLNETVVPMASREAHYLYSVEMKKRKLVGVFADHGIWVRVRDGFLSADAYDSGAQELRGITLYQIGPDYSLHDIVHAESAKWNGKSWQPEDLKPARRAGQRPGHGRPTPRRSRIDVKPADFGMLRQDPEEFSLWELDRYIHQLGARDSTPAATWSIAISSTRCRRRASSWSRWGSR